MICHEQYVGQTNNKFSVSWSLHHSNWKKQVCKTDYDQIALFRHYWKGHGTINKPPLHEAYTVTFVEQPSFHCLNICENKWYHQLDKQINIQNMIFPCEVILAVFCVFSDTVWPSSTPSVQLNSKRVHSYCSV